MSVKQIIVLRKDLGLSVSQATVQASHVTMAFLTEQLHWGRTRVVMKSAEADWINTSFEKVCLQVNSEKELLNVKRAADDLKVKSYMSVDTSSGGEIPTCLAIGPDESEFIDRIIVGLKPYDEV